MDPFDEFEFKPINEGLGFHNKKNNESSLPNRAQEMDFVEETLIPPAERVSKPFIVKSQLPREPISKEIPEYRQEIQNRSAETVDQILRTLNEKKKYDFAEATANYRKEMPEGQLKNSRFELSAGILDFMLITAGFLISMIVLLVVTKIDLVSNLLSPDEGNQIYLATLGLFALVVWTYLVAHRIFLGFTPGEWVFDQQIGRNQEIGTASYSVRVALRSTIVLLTGFALLPILSMLTRIDIAGKLTGAQIFKKA